MEFTSIIISLFACLTLASLVNSATISSTKTKNAIDLRWIEFKEKFNKVYASQEEDQMRFQLFAKRVQQVDLHNSQPLVSYTRGLNNFSDRTSDELSSLFKGTKSRNVSVSAVSLGYFKKQLKPTDTIDVPNALNWADHANRVGPVRSQGRCGSCWAFAATGLLEGQQVLTVNESVVPLSVQQLVDCNRDQYNKGCGGGFEDRAVKYIIKNGGIVSDRDYPYVSGKKKDKFECSFDNLKVVASTKRFKKVVTLATDEKQLKDLIARYGPIAVDIFADMDELIDYDGGVFYNEKCFHKHPDHAVLLVGYGTDSKLGDYWIIKNSWGEHWGLDGYLWLARNRDNHCAILESPTVVF